MNSTTPSRNHFFRAKHAIRYTGYAGTERTFRDFCTAHSIGEVDGQYHKVFQPHDIRKLRCLMSEIDSESKSPGLPPLIVTRVNKGGVGKTTITSNIAVALADQGYRVLLIDGDSQSSMTETFNIPWATKEVKHIGHLMLEECKLNDAIEPLYSEHMLDFIPATPGLDVYQRKIDGQVNKEKLFQRWLNNHVEELSVYDVILVDTNPATTTLNQVLSFPCPLWLVTMKLDANSVASMNVFASLMAEYNIAYKGERHFDMLLIANGLHEGQRPTRDALDALAEVYGDFLCDDIIPHSVGFMRQIDLFDPEKSAPLFESDPSSVAAQSILNLSRTLIKAYDIKLAGHAVGRAATTKNKVKK